MIELRNTYFSIQFRLSKMKGSYKDIADRVGRSKSWMSMFANKQISDVGVLLLADIEDAMNEIEASKTNSGVTTNGCSAAMPVLQIENDER